MGRWIGSAGHDSNHPHPVCPLQPESSALVAHATCAPCPRSGNLNPEVVSRQDLDNFREVWCTFDPDATQNIGADQLPDLVLALPPPMGLQGHGGRKEALRVCMRLNILAVKGKVEFPDVLDALVRNNGVKLHLSGEVSNAGAEPTTAAEIATLSIGHDPREQT